MTVHQHDSHTDAELVSRALEKIEGVTWLPNHHHGTPIEDHHADALSRYGVQKGETTLTAMNKVSQSTFHMMKPKRF
jgi:hypothetical protein